MWSPGEECILSSSYVISVLHYLSSCCFWDRYRLEGGYTLLFMESCHPLQSPPLPSYDWKRFTSSLEIERDVVELDSVIGNSVECAPPKHVPHLTLFPDTLSLIFTLNFHETSWLDSAIDDFVATCRRTYRRLLVDYLWRFFYCCCYCYCFCLMVN